MELKKMTEAELIEVYGTYGPQYFPSEELKPLTTVKWLLEQQIYKAYGYYDDDGLLLAYACMIQIPGQDTALLDYYAVLEQYRSTGIGGAFLKALAAELAELAGFYIESENPDYAQDEADLNIRRRRIAFYERNGACSACLLSQLFGVDYSILFLACGAEASSQTEQHSKDWHFQKLDSIYRNMFPAKYYDTKVRITRL